MPTRVPPVARQDLQEPSTTHVPPLAAGSAPDNLGEYANVAAALTRNRQHDPARFHGQIVQQPHPAGRDVSRETGELPTLSHKRKPDGLEERISLLGPTFRVLLLGLVQQTVNEFLEEPFEGVGSDAIGVRQLGIHKRAPARKAGKGSSPGDYRGSSGRFEERPNVSCPLNPTSPRWPRQPFPLVLWALERPF